MKKFDKFIAGTIFAFVILVVGVNIWTEKKLQGTDSFYKVELNRVKQELLMYEEKTGRAPEDIAVLKAFVGGDYKSIEAIAYIEKEKYVSDIVDASSNDFINFDVKDGEFYTKSLFDKIKGYYADKMQLALIDFSVDEGENILVKGDEDRTLEVVQNIVENAIKYGDGKTIRIMTDTDEESYTISIFNTGASLSDSELPHAFDSFFRGSNVGSKPGSGLGLYICRKLLHLMDGEIVAAGHQDGMYFKVTLRIA